MEVNLWCQSLESILNDGDALQVFFSWVKSESAEHPLSFHFSVVAYKEMIGRKDDKSERLAKEIYKKYLDPQKGLCQFVDLGVREQIGQKLSKSQLDETLFDPCLSYIQKFLQKQHAQFIRSEQFIELLNSSNDLNRPSTSSDQPPQECSAGNMCTPVMTRRNNNTNVRKQKECGNLLATQKLTPEILLRSQKERELILGQSSVEKMFQPPLTKYPYVCNATTSKNDSAVSSNFSSEANSHHKRSNAAFCSQSNRPQHQSHAHRPNIPSQRIDGACFRHETEEGRWEFADALTKRLHELDEKITRREHMNEQIQRINRQAMFSVRDVMISSEMKFPYGAVDEDDDLNNYVKQRMIEESGKPSPSQQQSPAGIPTVTGKIRRRSPKSCSPDYFPPHQQSKLNNIMSQSYFDPSTSNPMRIAAFQQAHKFKSNGFDLRATRYDYDEDTSGIGSMATTSQFSETSNSHHHFKERKERQKSSGGTRRQKVPSDFSEFSSLPRQRVTNNNQMKISYKASDGVPIVAHVPKQPITFKEFRRYLSISSKSRKQFFFKTKSDEPDVPYQLLLIENDSTLLPIFEGSIVAECRSMCDSE